MKDVPAKFGAEASDESILKKDLAAEEATAAETGDSDRAKAMFAAHKPSADAVFWSKFTPLKKDIHAAESGAEASVDETGVIKNPALKPATKAATALKPAAAGGTPLPSIKDFPEEEPAPAVSTSQHPSVHTRVLWGHASPTGGHLH